MHGSCTESDIVENDQAHRPFLTVFLEDLRSPTAGAETGNTISVSEEQHYSTL